MDKKNMSSNLRHIPEHPLPDEIVEMSRDDTVCQFCGVSYLIHHEMKMLEQKVVDLEESLINYQNMKQQYQNMEEELAKSRNAINKFEQILLEREKTTENIAKDCQRFKSKNERLEEDLFTTQNSLNDKKEKLKTSTQSYKKSLSNLYTTVLNIKRDFQEIKSSTEDSSLSFCKMLKSSQNEVISLIESKSMEIRILQEDYQIAVSQFNILENEKALWKLSQEKHIKEIELLKKSYDDLKNENANNILKSSEEISFINKKNSELIASIEKLEKQNKFAKQQIDDDKNKLKSKQEELDYYKVKAQENQESSNTTIKRLEHDKRELMRELHQIEDENNELKKTSSELKEENSKMSSELNLKKSESIQLDQMLDETRESVRKLIEEREEIVLSHKDQIKMMNDQFNSRLNEAQDNQKEIEEMKNKMRNELDEQERTLRLELSTELNIEIDKKNQELQNLRINNQRLNHNVESKLKELNHQKTQEIEQLKQHLEISSKNWQTKESCLNQENSSLKKVISELEDQLSKPHEYCDRETFEIMKTKIKELEEKTNDLNQQNLSQINQIKVLEDTVRRECEERFELIEALGQSQNQLTKFQKIISNQSGEIIQQISLPVSTINKSLKSSNDLSNMRPLDGASLRSVDIQNSSSNSKFTPFLPVMKHQDKSMSPSKDHRNSRSNSRSSDKSSSNQSTVNVDLLRKRIANAIKRR